MEAGQDDDDVVDEAVDELVREPAQQEPPCVTAEEPEKERIRSNLIFGLRELVQELRAETIALVFIPFESCADVRFGLRPVDQSRRMATKTLTELVRRKTNRTLFLETIQAPVELPFLVGRQR